ncbi:MAG: T9SS type A sorting domain-containing protein [Ignavibacteriaceae bacterium]|nr:T9SS type A sorting domain-containing protein [Ignavibacteriaceae bacterium]
MKLYSSLLVILFLWYACSAEPATINGRFVIVSADPSNTSVLLQINTNSGNAALGGATIVFDFNTSAISINENPIQDVDYTFHNFSGENYSVATITRPLINTIWVNIDLPYVNSNNGTTVSANPEWTDVVTIHFNTVDLNVTQDLTWLTNSLFWGIYDADNSTIWENGVFEDFPTSVEPVSDLPTNFELSQNYPNPFNPSTKIKFTIPYVTLSGVEGSVPVKLQVYDILGNEVATLVNEEKAPGVYEVEFGGASHSGDVRNLASGIYIYRLQASEFSDTKKMILLR